MIITRAYAHPAIHLGMRALIVALVAVSLPSVAQAASAPSAPVDVQVAEVAGSARPTAQLRWAASTDSDGVITGYLVEHRAGVDQPWVRVDAGAALQADIPELARGATHVFRVIAVDNDALESTPSAEVSLAVEPATLAVTWQLRVRGNAVRATRCVSIRRACRVSTRRGIKLRGTSTPVGLIGGSDVQVRRRYRAPGSRRTVNASTLHATLSAGGVLIRNATAPRMLGAAGTWCLRMVIPATAETNAARSRERCVRVSPPVTIGWAGDIVLGSADYGRPPGDGSSVFNSVRALLRSPDLMIGNYEGTLSTGGHRRCNGGDGCFIFQAPPRMANALVGAGFDVMNIANNHCLDMGSAARAQTVRSLTSRGIGVTGMPGRITYRMVRDTRVAMVGFGFTPGTMDLDDVSLTRRMVRRAARSADVVVVAMHNGTEGARAAHTPAGDEDGRGHTRRFARTAIDAGADLVVGSGPHVVRGVERRAGRYIIYSTGNFVGWHNFAMGGLSSQSGIVHMTLGFTGVRSAARWHGVQLTGPGIPVVDHSSHIVRHVGALSRADFHRTAARFTRSGSFV